MFGSIVIKTQTEHLDVLVEKKEKKKNEINKKLDGFTQYDKDKMMMQFNQFLQ